MPGIEPPYIQYLVTKIFRYVELKTLSGFLLSALAYMFDVLNKDALIAVLVLIIVDFITGIAVAKKSGKEIKSAKVFRSALKTVIYFLIISAGHLAEKATNGVIPFIDDTITGFLAVTELISILENAGNLGFAVPKKMLNKLTDFTHNQ